MWIDQDRERCFDRVSRSVSALPATAGTACRTHLRLAARDKGFGYVMAVHHGDGRLAVSRRAPVAPPERLRELATDG